MHKLARKLTLFIYRRFTFFWVIITILMLSLCSYINWHNNIRNSCKIVAQIASDLSFKVDNLFNGIFQDAHSIPAFEKNNLDCAEMIPYLQHVIMNHPEISSLAISDKDHQFICSTLPKNKTFLLSKNSHETIRGPLLSPMFNHPIYAVQKNVGDYDVEIVIMSSILENVLHTSDNNVRSVILFDTYQKKNIIQINYKKTGTWIYNKFIQYQPIAATSNPIFASVQLSSLKDVLIIISEHHHTIISNLWYNQILLILDVLVISLCSYWLIKNIFVRYYSLPGAIKKGIKRKQFYPVYQPLFDTKTSTYSGAEVLLRWQNNLNEIIMPDLFIGEAENTGLIVPITLQIVEIAFQETQVILKAAPKFYLSFNISALHFTDSHFFTQFDMLMELYSISPTQILFEITERDLLDESNVIYIKKMKALREAGYSLAVDDYGTGHSSITYLQYFPFNYLKIDKIFIQAIGTKAITETLNDAIINLAKKIDLTIIAEGVETREQVNYLLQNEVRFLQGWYFSKALSIEQLISLLKGEKK